MIESRPNPAIILAILGFQLCSCDFSALIREEFSLRGHSNGVTAVAFSPDGTLLASKGGDRTVIVWDPVTHRSRLQFGGLEVSDRGGIAFAVDGRTLASGRSDLRGAVIRWDLASHRELPPYPWGNHPWEDETGAGCYSVNHTHSVAYSRDGNFVASGHPWGHVLIWNLPSGVLRSEIHGHKVAVDAVAFSPDGSVLVSGSRDHTVALWDPRTGRESARLTGHTAQVTSLAFAPDGKTLASGSSDRTVRLWRVGSAAPGAALKGHRRGVCAVAYHPRGHLVAWGDAGGLILLWNPASSRLVGQVKGHQGTVNALDFFPDGRTLVSGGQDGFVRLWSINLPARDVSREHVVTNPN